MENLVAACLLKHVYGKIDYLAENYALHYLQTKERKEVDFALVREQEIEAMIEVKRADGAIGEGLRYFYEKYAHPAIQLVKELKRERVDKGIQLIKASNYLEGLFL